jgi:hypothetical protein
MGRCLCIASGGQALAEERAQIISDLTRVACYAGVCLVAPLLCGLPLILFAWGLAFVGLPYLFFFFVGALYFSAPVVWVLGPIILWCLQESKMDGPRFYVLAGAAVGFATSLFLTLGGGWPTWAIAAALCVGPIQGIAVGATIYALAGRRTCQLSY